MLRKFVNDEGGYLEWVSTNPNGFVVNVDEPQSWLNYPMVHLSTCKHIHSAARTNYTTGRYFKVCSTDFDELQRWSVDTYKKELTRCRHCQRRLTSTRNGWRGP